MRPDLAKQPTSGGMETTPPVFEKPYLRDPFLWLLVATAAFWALVIWYFFF